MTKERRECRCGRPTRDNAYVCDECREGRLDHALGQVAWLDDQLDTSIAKTKAASLAGGARSAEAGLPWHEKAATARRALHSTLVWWVRFAQEESVRGVPNWQPTDRLPSLARWLLHVTRGMALRDIGPDMVDQITDAVAECERIIYWKRRFRVYLGTCGQRVEDEDGVILLEKCPGEVYADEGAAVGKCDSCDQGVTVVIRQAELNQALDDRLCSPAELARLAVILGLDAPRDEVRRKIVQWHRQNRIERRGTEPGTEDSERPTPLFRYGEVRPLLYAAFADRSA